MTRADFQTLAEQRIGDADVLLRAGRFPAAYYLAGLAVECALKACIAKNSREFEFPDLNRAKAAWQHNLDALLDAADLRGQRDQFIEASLQFKANWNTVRQWQVDRRYNAYISSADAEQMYLAATETEDGVLSWLRTLW